MSTKKSTPKRVPVPQAPDFRAYEHGFPAKAHEVKIGMVYMFDGMTPIKIIARHGQGFEVEHYDFGLETWLPWDFLVNFRHLKPYTVTDASKVQLWAHGNRKHWEAEERRRKQRQREEAKTRALGQKAADALGYDVSKVHVFPSAKRDPMTNKVIGKPRGYQVTLTLTAAEFTKLIAKV